ncbi:MAG: NUDIX domain-containing protein [Parcubacteria group bacterium]|jgi:ADP-ribose pyrophosphatase YjhB (NUDIX family)
MDWQEFDQGVFLVNLLGIVYDPQKKLILIGKRKNDTYIRELSWSFPGGRPGYKEDLEHYLKLKIKEKASLDVDVKKIIFAKSYPEKREFLSIYYLCEAAGGREKAGGKFTEVKWVEPADVQHYFTTSLHPFLLGYLKSLK